MSRDDLIDHWLRDDRSDGRVESFMQLREHFLGRVGQRGSILEIGPFFRPALRGENVSYFDVLDSDELKERAARLGFSDQAASVPDIRWVSPEGDLSVVSQEFDAAFSSHCIEHQPDLIRHLEQVASVLKPDGNYYLIIPDKRYCFDHFLRESSADAIISAVGRRNHAFLSIVEHRALTTHNDPERHWKGDHKDPGFEFSVGGRASAAAEEFFAADGAYVDVHAWQFTPASFARAVRALHATGHTRLTVKEVFATPYGRQEFTAVLGFGK